MTAKRIAITAMMSALCAVLGSIALDLGFIKISFESLPVIIAGLMMGPVNGMLVGAAGTFISQLIRYGFSPTMPLWMLPYIVCGFLCGSYAKKYNYYNTNRQIWKIIILAELLVLAFNTLAIYIDSKIFGYYSVPYVWGSLGVRFLAAAIKTAAFGFIALPVLRAMAKVTGRRK